MRLAFAGLVGMLSGRSGSGCNFMPFFNFLILGLTRLSLALGHSAPRPSLIHVCLILFACASALQSLLCQGSPSSCWTEATGLEPSTTLPLRCTPQELYMSSCLRP